MPQYTTPMSLPYPLGSEKPYIAQAIQALAEKVAAQAATVGHSHDQTGIPAKVAAASVADTLAYTYSGTVSGAVTGTIAGLANSNQSVSLALSATHDSANHTNLVRKDGVATDTDTMARGLIVSGNTFARTEGGSSKNVVFENPNDGRTWSITSNAAAKVRNYELTTTSAGSTSSSSVRTATVLSGEATVSFNGTDNYATVRVVIPSTIRFTSTPNIVASVSTTSTTITNSNYNVAVLDVDQAATTTGFLLHARTIVDSSTPSNGTTVVINWIAIGT